MMSTSTLTRCILLRRATVLIRSVAIVKTNRFAGDESDELMGNGDCYTVKRMRIGWQNVSEKVARILKGKSGN
jgi:hypothetical protein